MKYTSRDPYSDGEKPLYTYSSLSEMLLGKDLVEDRSPAREVANVNQAERNHLYLRSITTSAVCPYCGKVSYNHNGYTYRHPQWQSIDGIATVGHVLLRRYICCNPNCSKKTFTETISGLTRYRHNSDIILRTIFAITVFCSACTTSLVCHHLGIEISHDTAGRLFKRISIADQDDIKVIGVDDVAYRKGMNYNTVIYDAETGMVIALLDGRDGKQFKEWLKNHRNVEIVCRDRASAFAKAVKEILGDKCEQVADKFHILKNLMDYMKKLIKIELPNDFYIDNGKVAEGKAEKYTQKLISQVDSKDYENINYNTTPPVDMDGNPINIIPCRSEPHNAQEKKNAENRKKKYETVKAMRAKWNATENPNYLDFVEKYGMAVATIKKYINFNDNEVESIVNVNHFKKKASKYMEAYDNIIYKMLADKQYPNFIYCYILSIGYRGRLHTLRDHIRNIAQRYFHLKTNRYFGYHLEITTDYFSRNDILKYITIRDKQKMKDTIVAKYFDQILEKYPKLQRLMEIWNDGYDMVMGKDVKNLDAFINKYKGSEISAFVNGIVNDIKAVSNGITMELSSGFVEGSNNKEKLMKRIMYGRASTGTLFGRFQAAMWMTKVNGSINDILYL